VWQLTAEQTAAALDVDPDRGLGSDEAAARLDRYGPNRLQESARVPEWKKFIAQLADPLIYLLLAAVVIALGAWVAEGREGIPFDALVIAAIVVLNAVLGYVQEARAEEAVEALQKMAAVTATVVRDGEEQEIATAEVVPGDILILGEGDSVSADARLIRSANLMVGEASLTGESEPVSKRTEHLEGSVELGDRINMVFNGTAVNRGRGRAIAVATGMDTEMGKIARLLGETEDDPTPLQVEVARIGKALGIAVVVIAAVVMGTILLTSDISSASDLVGVLLVGVSLAVAAVPEGLPAILSVVLALGVQRMAGQNAIVKRLSSVETLGSASVVCSDKTGTLTRSEMMIERIVTPSGEISVSGSGYTPEGELRHNGKQLDDETLAKRGGMGAGGREPGQRRPACPTGWTLGHPGRSHRGRLPGSRGQDGPDRRAPAPFRTGGRDPVHLRAQADVHAGDRS
jgi:P-type Ca2+ transporter type 2C